jgi:TPR repeat protein
LLSVSLLVAIFGSWSGWQFRNEAWFRPTAIASVGSLYGILPQKPAEPVDDEVKAGLANELAKRAAGVHQDQNSSSATAKNSLASLAPTAAVAVATPASANVYNPPASASAYAPPASASAYAPPAAASIYGAPGSATAYAAPSSANGNVPAVQASRPTTSPARSSASLDPDCCDRPSSPPDKELGAAPIAAEPTVQSPSAPDISAEEQQQMLQRVSTLLSQGDISGARMLLERLDRLGNGQASFELAQTYDSAALKRWNVIGVKPDADKAMQFYKRALAEGNPEAKARLASSAPQR